MRKRPEVVWHPLPLTPWAFHPTKLSRSAPSSFAGTPVMRAAQAARLAANHRQPPVYHSSVGLGPVGTGAYLYYQRHFQGHYALHRLFDHL